VTSFGEAFAKWHAEGDQWTNDRHAAADKGEQPTYEQVTAYTITVAPPHSRDSYHWMIEVTWRGDEQWAVVWMGSTLSRDGTWDWEPSPSNREDDYLERCRFDLDTALALARRAAPGLTVNGRTYAEWQKQFEAERW
jgi:hypothetical protein